MALEKKAGIQSFEIKNLKELDGKVKYHMLFIAPENAPSLPDITNKLKGRSTLLITEKPGLAKQGAAINFVVQNNRQRFELNKANAEKYNLKVSGTLVTLSIPIE